MNNTAMRTAAAAIWCLAGGAYGQAYGSWDSFSATTVVQGEQVTVNGWGADAVSGTSGLVANVYVDGNFAVQQPIGNVYRPDVANAFGRARPRSSPR